MKKQHLFLLALCVAGTSLPALSRGQSALNAPLPVSRPAAILPVTLTQSSVNLVGAPFRREPVARGTVNSFAGTTIDVTNAVESDGSSIDAGDYNQNAANQPVFYVQIVGGPQRGKTYSIVSNTATTITVNETVTGLDAGVDQFVVTPFQTLNALFGPTNNSELDGGSAASNSDVIEFTNSAGVYASYFYKNTAPGGGTGFKLTTAPTGVQQGDVPIRANGGLLIRRNLTSPGTLYLNGVAFSGRQKVDIVPGFNLVTWPRERGAVTLTQSRLQDFLDGGSAASNADVFGLESGGVFTQYFYKNTAPGGGVGYKPITNPTGPDVGGTVTIRPGDSIIIRRNLGTNTAVNVEEAFETGP